MSAKHRIELPSRPASAALAQVSRDALLSARWQARCEALREAGREEGAREALEGPARRLDEAALTLEAALDEAREELARAAVELGLDIARQLVRAELAAGRHDVERIVRETLAHSGVGRGSCVVHLNPADAERLRHVAFRSGTRVEPDEAVPRGSVHVTGPKGLLVHDVDACLEAIAERLRGEL